MIAGRPAAIDDDDLAGDAGGRGNRVKMMLERCRRWDITTAKKTAGAVEEYRSAWLQDIVLAHDVDATAER